MSCAPDSNPILIAGAGPTGLVLAISLLKQGVPVRLIDKDSTYRVGYKGSGIMVSFLFFRKLAMRVANLLPVT
ncbi:hypothetical protein CPB85DRAFT_1293246 [Mucidula mucida]|nr:hypothetical protein CPB85DRAFT_1293246 [Mucidula mucida]